MNTNVKNWIWRDENTLDINQYVWCRRVFQATPEANASLRLSIDGDFIAFLNGQEIGRGQFPDYPQDKTWTEVDLRPALADGPNELLLFLYHAGEDFATGCRGSAALWAEIILDDATITTDPSWLFHDDPVMHSGKTDKTTMQLGFATLADFRRLRTFLEPDGDAAGWTAAAVLPETRRLSERPTPPRRPGELIYGNLCAQGGLIRQEQCPNAAKNVEQDFLCFMPVNQLISGVTDEYVSPPLKFASEKGWEIMPPPAPANGVYLILDLGREAVGYLQIDVEATRGTVIDISHGEHLADGKVRNRVGSRYFTDRLICGSGITRYQLPFRKVAGRYLQLNITKTGKCLKFYTVGLISSAAKIEPAGEFKSSDSLLELLDKNCIRTLQLCKQEHFDDCPWREQGLYTYDARNQALFGYPLWGDYRFAAASLDLSGKGIRDDGFLELCSPAKIPLTIPIFSFVWICAVRDAYLYSGKTDLFDANRQQIAAMLCRYESLFDETQKLYRLPDGNAYWHFYEWVDGLCATDSAANPQVGKVRELDALFNCYFLEMLDAYAELLDAVKSDAEAAQIHVMAGQLRQSIHLNFWSETDELYRSFPGGSDYHLHTQILAFLTGVVPLRMRTRLLANLGKVGGITYSAMPNLVRGLMDCSKEARIIVQQKLRELYLPPVLSGGDTMWETPNGNLDFSGAGSLCHGWSALPAFYHREYVLGIRPLSPGYLKFQITPYSAELFSAAGSIATPHGTISVKWQKTDLGLEVELTGPPLLQPEVKAYPECPIRQVLWNNRKI